MAAPVAAGVALLLLLPWHAADVLLRVFAAILLAVALRGLGEMVGRATGLSEGWSRARVTEVEVLAAVRQHGGSEAESVYAVV